MQTTFAGHPISDNDIFTAMRAFDSQYPNPNDYDNWLTKGNYHYAVEHNQKIYPVKFLLGYVTGIDTPDFHTKEAKQALMTLGFTVIDKPTGNGSTKES